MTPSEHAAKAEEQLALAAEEWDDAPASARYHVARAQVHATLAAASPQPVMVNSHAVAKTMETLFADAARRLGSRPIKVSMK